MGQRRSSSERVATAAAGLAVATLSLLAWPAVAHGQDDCDTVVVDETSQLDVGEVEAAAAEVDGATVRVRFYDAAAGGSLDAAMGDLIASCWPGPGGVQADLLLVAVSLDERRTVFRWGEALAPGLADGGDDIAPEQINPRLADGDFTGAVVAGLGAADAALEDAADAAAGGATDDDGDGGVSGLVPLGGLAGLAVLGGGAIVAVRRRRLGERRRALDEIVAEPLGRAGDLRERGRQLELRCGVAEQVLAGAALTRLDDLRSTARDAGHEVDSAVVLLRQAMPDGVERADHDQLEAGEARAAELAAAVTAHDGSLSTLDRGLRRLEELRETLPAKRDLLVEELADTRHLVGERAEEGWRTDELSAVVDRLDAELGGIDLSPLRLDLDTLSQRVEQAEADLFATRHALQALPERKAGLASWAEQLAESARLERQRARAAGEELVRLAGVHDPASFASLADNPANALAALERADAVRDEAMDGPFHAQDWDEVGRRLEEAGLHLFIADAELDEVDKTSIELADAQARAGRVLAQAHQALEEVGRYVEAHDDDLGPRFDTEPVALAAALSGLGDELRRARPNYLRVLQTAEHGMADLQRLMVDAQDEQARVSALRRQAEQEVDWAVGAVARARQAMGWQLFASDDAADLDQLEESLAQLPTDLEARVEAAQAITTKAHQIEMRIVSRRRRGSIWIVGGPFGGWGGGGWGGGSGGGSSGGGGFGGGSFGGGGFGGGSFGGGGFGGGGGGGSSW